MRHAVWWALLGWGLGCGGRTFDGPADAMGGDDTVDAGSTSGGGEAGGIQATGGGGAGGGVTREAGSGLGGAAGRGGANDGGCAGAAPVADGCNSCSCYAGQWACSTLYCFPDAGVA